jgi:hypothetical protein
MKPIIQYALPVLLFLWSAGCTPQSTTIDVDIAIICDITDPMVAYPNPEEITSQLGLTANPWQGVRITVTYISDKNINDVQVVTLDAENRWTGNTTLRKAKIQKAVSTVPSSEIWQAACLFNHLLHSCPRGKQACRFHCRQTIPIGVFRPVRTYT